VSAFANAIAIPVVTLAIVPLALAGILVPLDAPWIVAHALLSVLMRYLEWLAVLPLAAWQSHAPLAWTVPVAVGGILWLLAPRGVPGRALGVLWALPMALLLPPRVPDGAVRIVVLDVGQGLAVLVATAHHALVYDTGPRFNDSVDAGARIVVPFLRADGIVRLDALIVSHADADHSGGALTILRAVPVGTLVSSLPADHAIAATARRKASVHRCVDGQRWEWDGVAFEFVHPAAAAYDDAARKSNDLSCVLHVASNGGSALLAGDVEAASESEMLARNARLAADVLVVPHHGSRTSSTPAFIAKVAPRFAAIAAGYRNRFGHPRAEILARYEAAGAIRARTDVEGAITLTLQRGESTTAIGERDRVRRYWYDAPPR
jgi:competence protein ComEC